MASYALRVTRIVLRVVTVACCVTVAGDPSVYADHNPSHGVRVALANAGYTPVPATILDSFGRYSVELRLDDHKLIMLVDTGSGATVLDTEAAERVGLKWEGTEIAQTAGGLLNVGGTVLSRYSVGGVRGGYLAVRVGDLKRGAGAGSSPRKLGFDGILGQDFMRRHAAHIDLAGGVLYLRPASAEAVKALAGKWVCTAGEAVDGPIPADACAGISYNFDEDRVHLKTRKMEGKYFFITEPNTDPARMMMYSENTSDPKVKRMDTSASVYKLDKDTLTVALNHVGGMSDWDKAPKDFKPTKDWVIFHLKRAPAAPAAKP